MMCGKMPSIQSSLLFLFLLPLLSFFSAQASVPQNETFRFVNEGEFGPYIVEYDGNYRVLGIFSSPFQFCFYNTTPNAYTLALRMAVRRSESLYRWVWEANRSKPVRENATLTFGTDGNLVLADVDGKIAWQTNTANKGVVGLKLLPTGNLVLYDSKGKFIWQSFDYPTDTVLVGQSLKRNGTANNKLVSRASEKVNANGPYSLVLEAKGWSLFYQSKYSRKPLIYYSQRYATLDEYKLTASYNDNDGTTDVNFDGILIVTRPKYNATLTFMRLGIDGNIRYYTYDNRVDWSAWENTFTLFDRNSFLESECQLPERCGNLGICEDNQCVACPLSSGLAGWSKSCKAKVRSCNVKEFDYYKVEGVDHFLSKYNKGSAVKESDCRAECSKDCKCLGYFYNQESSRCWIAYELKTLAKVANSTHVGYIKFSKL